MTKTKRKWYGGDSGGWLVPGVRCPMKRCREQVVYNGNYFCSRWGNGCNWALSHSKRSPFGPVGKRDKAVWAEIEVAWEEELS